MAKAGEVKVMQAEVSNLRFSVSTSGSGDVVGTEQVASFRFDGKAVSINLKETIYIENGDLVQVAGREKDGALQSFGYNNVSNGARGRGPAGSVLLFVFALVLASTIMVLVELGLIVFAVPILWFASRLFMKYSMVKEANETLDKLLPPSRLPG